LRTKNVNAMSKELTLQIDFTKKSSENEQTVFIEEFEEFLDSSNLQSRLDYELNSAEWVIDYSFASIPKDEVIDIISEFLLDKDDLIKNSSIS
jgi:hypothetical protein